MPIHRLPTPGADDGQWGDILNDFLDQSHTATGSLKDGVVSATNIQDSIITDVKISSTAAISRTKLASDVQASLTKADSVAPLTTSTWTSGTLAIGVNLVDATSGAKTPTLPTPTVAGQLLSIEKTDSSVNAVTISGTIRGSAGSLALTSQNQAILLEAESLTSWRPFADHRTKASLDATYSSLGLPKFGTVDKRIYVSKTGSDANDGLAPGGAKLTIGAALTALAGGAGGEIILGVGTWIEEFTLTDGLRIRGSGKALTIIKAVSGSTNAGAIMSPVAAPIQNIVLEDFTLQGNGNAGQSGLYFPQGTASIAPGAGAWYGLFRRVVVKGFALHQIWLQGGSTNGLNPHQFLTFQQVAATGVAAGYALFLTGQVGQVDFYNCEFDGPGMGSGGTNIRLNRECSDTLGATIVTDEHPYAINFYTLTSQSNDLAVYIDRASPALFVGPYFENIYRAITCVQSSVVRIISPIFANAAYKGDSTGYGVSTASSAVARVMGPLFTGNVETSFKNAGGSLLVDGDFESTSNPVTSGMTLQQGNSTTISLGTAKTHYLNSGASAVNTINAKCVPGDVVYLKAFGGSVNFATGGNLSLGSRTSPVTLPQNAWATFVRQDLGGTAWELISTSA
jgi:hypothetical protein